MSPDFHLRNPEQVLWEMYKAAIMNEVANDPKVRDEFTALYEDLVGLIKKRLG